MSSSSALSFRPAARFVGEFGRIAIFLGEIAASFFNSKFYWGEFIFQLNLIAKSCLFPVIAVMMPVSMGMAIQGLVVLGAFGAEPMLSTLIVTSVVRELSPMLASIAIIAQAGSSMAAEIGAMKVREEVDALEALAIQPIAYLATPRVLACLIIAPMLHLIGSFFGVLAGYFYGVVVAGNSHGYFIDNMWFLINYWDLAASLVKMCLFGLLIGLIATYKGYTVTGGPAGVGRAVNSANILCVFAVIFSNYVLTSFFFGLAK